MATTHERARAHFARVQSEFEALVELAAGARAARLVELERSDAELARELARLFAAERAAPAFLEEPAETRSLEGTRVGAWRVEERLASGGMGEVWRVARADTDHPWRAALKVLRAGSSREALERRFASERRTLAALSHPDVVSLIDAGTLDDGRPWFVMELVEGLPLTRYCDGAGLDLRARIQLFLRVCAAVRHAHQRFVLHCDLKPSNILVTAEGHPKLLDFGIAELLSAAAGSHGWPITPGYSSPEQVRGEALTVAADVWSLGALLHELLTGELPRRASETAFVRPSEVAGATPDGRPQRAVRALRGDLDALVLRALAARASERYASVDDLAADLNAYLAGRALAARAERPWERALRVARRHPWTVLATAVAVLSLAASSVLFAREMLRGRDEARQGWRAHAEAVQVTRLLEDVLKEAGLRELVAPEALERSLDRAALRAGESFGSAPETLGRLRIAFGALYLEIDRPEKARDELVQGLALARAHRGFGKEDLQRAAELLAEAETRLTASGER